jgi:Uma2 family endonuclease
MTSGTAMHHASKRDVWTYAEYARLPDDGNRYEVIDGEVLVTPAPGTRHQNAAAKLFMEVYQYVLRHDLGYVLWDVDLLVAEGQFLRPDFLYVPKDRHDGITDRGVEVTPALVVEVLSPSSRSIDLVKKPRRYRDFAVPEYWVADRAENVVYHFAFAVGNVEPRRIEGTLHWHPSGAPVALAIDLSHVFADF